MICRVAMLPMHRDGLIRLAAPRRRHYHGTLHRRRTAQAEPELPIVARVDALPGPQVRPLADQREAQLWREYVERYHYLGYTPLPGAQQRYLVISVRQVGGRRGVRRKRLEGGSGTSYRAADWIHVGQTQGRGKLDVNKLRALPNVTSDATCAPLSILLPTGRPSVHPEDTEDLELTHNGRLPFPFPVVRGVVLPIPAGFGSSSSCSTATCCRHRCPAPLCHRTHPACPGSRFTPIRIDSRSCLQSARTMRPRSLPCSAAWALRCRLISSTMGSSII